MLQVRIHGRGGQGVVTAAEILSLAAFLDGKYALAFPTFGSERMGAPVTAFCRISDAPLRAREPVINPDAVIIQDSTLLHQADVFKGISPEGYVLINSTRSLEELGLGTFCSRFPAHHCTTIPATDFALKHLGRPIANAALVAGFAVMTQTLTRSSVEQAIKQKFPGHLGDLNALVAGESYDYLSSHPVGT